MGFGPDDTSSANVPVERPVEASPDSLLVMRCPGAPRACASIRGTWLAGPPPTSYRRHSLPPCPFIDLCVQASMSPAPPQHRLSMAIVQPLPPPPGLSPSAFSPPTAVPIHSSAAMGLLPPRQRARAAERGPPLLHYWPLHLVGIAAITAGAES